VQLVAEPALVVTLYVLPVSREELAVAPVLRSNPAPAQPFEFLVKLLSLPRYGTIDPTSLMALFLPVFFGMTLGDVAYGAILVVIALILQRRLGKQSETWRDLSRILLLCALWSIVFGVIYGEFLGNLGHDLGMEPLWINREEALRPLLIFSIAVGVAHVTLGLCLGAWNAWRQRHGHELMEKIGMLAALSGLFLLTVTAVGFLPGGFFTPGIAALVVGLVLLIRAQGALGLMTAPLEMLSTLGNMLSYLRIAAIGLSSVYLARVANELAGSLGVLWLGIIIAVLFHALNVALGAFSPMIHSLRLHYVEFFGKFYEEGGTPFQPFGSPQGQG
jgi:V/A-type H+-transporting ATPase subunit I